MTRMQAPIRERIPSVLAQFAQESGYDLQYYQPGATDRRAELAENKQVDAVSGCTDREAVSGAEQVTLFQAEIDGQTVTYSLIFTDSAPEDFVQALRSYLSGVTQPEWTGGYAAVCFPKPAVRFPAACLHRAGPYGLPAAGSTDIVCTPVPQAACGRLNAFVPLIRKPVWIPWNTCSAVFLPLFMTKTVCFTMLFIFIWISDTSSGSEGTWPPLQCGATRLPFSGHVSVPAALLLRRQMLVLLL